MLIQGGEGLHESSYDGGDGGHVLVSAGESHGRARGNSGGDISVTAGNSFEGVGGSVLLSSGKSSTTSSGNVLIKTEGKCIADLCHKFMLIILNILLHCCHYHYQVPGIAE